jgi:Zn-dependent protease with chaperone function
MLNTLWKLVEDEADVEAKALADMVKEHPELPDWSAGVQPLLDKVRTANDIKRELVCRVLSGMPFGTLALSHKTIVLAESVVEFCRGRTAQMAFVLAHEVSHVHRGHGRERFGATDVAGMLTLNPIMAFGMKKLLDTGRSRDNEFAADRDALAFCHRAGYAPHAGVEFLERLTSGEVPRDTIKQYLAAHPPLTERIAALRAGADKLTTAQSG